MEHDRNDGTAAGDLVSTELEAVRQLIEEVNSGKEWQLALLEAVGMWTTPEEEFQGRRYSYMVLGEAFDWLILAERLCAELDGLVPLEEKEQLLFHGWLPEHITTREFQQLIGYSKHRAFLNYWYGVVVEEALQLAVEDEVRKQQRSRSRPDSEDMVEEAFLRLYEDTRANLADEFIKGKGDARRKSLTLSEMKEFTYSLFKRRVNMWDPARVASDTRKGLEKLESLRSGARLVS